MAVFNLSASATIKLFNEYVLPGVSVEVRENSSFYDRFKTDTEHCVGKYAVFKAMTKFTTSARASSSSTLPTAKQGTYDEFTLFMKRGMYANLQFDGLAMACQKGKGAVVDVLKQEIKNITIFMANTLNKQFWGDGSGRLAQLEAASSNSTTVQIDGPLFGQDASERTDPGNYIAEGMSIDIYDGSGNLEVEDVEISTYVDDGDGTGTLTMAEAVTASDDGYIFAHDTYGAARAAGIGVPMGLAGIVATTDPYVGITQVDYQGVDRATYSWARAQYVNHSSAAFASGNMLKLIHRCERFGRINVIATNDVIWRCIYQIWETDKTMPNQKTYWGGLEGLTFYGGRKGAIPIIYDTDCPDNQMFALDESTLAVYAPTNNGLTWLPGHDGGVLTRVGGKDEYTASLVWYYNFGCARPQSNGLLDNVKHATS